MLSFDKAKWPAFYFEYVKNAPKAFSLYHKMINIDEKKIGERISSFERRYVDSCYQSIHALAPYEYGAARVIVKLSKGEKMDLSKVKVYIMGALRVGAIFSLDESSIFVDVLSLYDVGFSKLPEIVEDAFQIKKVEG